MFNPTTKNVTNALQISKCPLVLQPNLYARTIGQVDFSFPAYSYVNACRYILDIEGYT